MVCIKKKIFEVSVQQTRRWEQMLPKAVQVTYILLWESYEIKDSRDIRKACKLQTLANVDNTQETEERAKPCQASAVTSPIYRTRSYNPYNYGVGVTVPEPANADSGIKGPAQRREVHPTQSSSAIRDQGQLERHAFVFFMMVSYRIRAFFVGVVHTVCIGGTVGSNKPEVCFFSFSFVSLILMKVQFLCTVVCIRHI